MENSFSVCMSVYKGDKPDECEKAILSVINQTVSPSEIIIVVDPTVSEEVANKIKELQQIHSIIKPIWLERSVFFGEALQIAVDNSSHELIARMDMDDISLPDRFEKQLKCFEADDELSVVGGVITEFYGEEDNIVGKRWCPLTDAKIKRYMKYRCGLSHVAVMMRKKAIIDSGHYQNWTWNEDYYLWIRMMEHGCKFKNLEDVLVNVRVTDATYTRRGGMLYYKGEIGLQKYMLEHHIISLPQYAFNVIVRVIIEVLMPSSIRRIFWKKILRSS